MSQLFREEAVEHATRRLNGTVVLATPLSVKLLSGLLAAILFAAVTFAAMATYTSKSTVNGWLIPEQGLIRATASAQGYVARLLVKEGDAVKKGTRIAEISLSTETSRGNLAEALAQGVDGEARALDAKKTAQSARFAQEKSQIPGRIAALGKELEQARSQAKLQQARVDLASTLVSRGEAISKKGLITNRDMSARQSELLEAQQLLADYRRQASALEREQAELQARLTAIPIEEATAEAERLSAEAVIAQRAADIDGRHAQFIVAPLEGVVEAIPVSIGQTVTAGTTIAVVSPKDSRIEVELLAPSRAIGFVREGQEVRLMLQAFPFQRFGALPATVRTVSSTVLAPTEISIPGLKIEEPVFRVRARIARNSITAYGKTMQLQPGMLLTADIVLDRRSLIGWLFDPIFAAGRRL